MTQNINFIQFLLEYSETMLFLYLERSPNQNEEFKGYIKNLGGSSLTCTNIYGNTRCFTTTSILNYIFGIDESVHELECNNDNLIKLENVQQLSNIHDLIRISITPDHIFFLLKSHTGNWFMISSWVKLYSFNIIKIDFNEFMVDFLDIYCKTQNMNDRVKNNTFKQKYLIFLAKYFVYKTAIHNNSLYISTDMNFIRAVLKNIANDFLKTDYYGNNGRHSVSMKFFNINYNDLSNLKSSLLSNFIKYSILNYGKITDRKDYKSYMRSSVSLWLNSNNLIKAHRRELNGNDLINYNDSIEALGQSILEVVDFSDKGNLIIYEPLRNEDILYAGQNSIVTKIYGKKIMRKMMENNNNIDFVENLYGGYFDNKLHELRINPNKTAYEYLFKFWNLISFNNTLKDLLINPINNVINTMNNPSIEDIVVVVTDDIDNIHEIEYIVHGIHKKSYIICQIVNYRETDKHMYLFIDNVNTNQYSNRLIMIDFAIETITSVFNSSYVIIGNTFYRDIITDIQFTKMNMYKKIQNDNFFIKLKQSVDNYIFDCIQINANAINRNELLNYYQKYTVNLLQMYDNTDEFTKNYFKKIKVFSDALYELQTNNLIDTPLQLQSIYVPFLDESLVPNTTKKNYEIINV